MYGKLVKRLRNRRICIQQSNGLDDFPLLREAADAIEELDTLLDGVSADNEALCETIEKLKNPRWIPVTERLPDVGKDVLCFCRANICFVLGWDGNHWHEGADRYYMSGFVTHWMPLPEPPKEET